jgi:hypothetical protein
MVDACMLGQKRLSSLICLQDEGAMSWVQASAMYTPKLSAKLQCSLQHKNFVSFIVEWCNTPLRRAKAFCTPDACFVFDDNDRNIAAVPICLVFLFFCSSQFQVYCP